ncbi:MAG: coenzyme F420-0:L-glutamate ligase [Terriglobales bacterium]
MGKRAAEKVPRKSGNDPRGKTARDIKRKVQDQASGEIRILPIAVEGEVHRGASLTSLVVEAARAAGLSFENGDVLVVKHKVVSKSEGAMIPLDTIHPSAASRAWARRYKLDARVCELAVRESRRIVRRKHGVLITETRHGFICANGGVDVSNVDGGQHALLLPAAPDRTAAQLRREIGKQEGVEIAVIISDSFGRPWREGLTEVAIGVAGMRPLVDYRGRRDRHGYVLHSTIDAIADELACAAGLVCGKLERVPACIVRGYSYRRGCGTARELLRPARRDLFR